MDDVMGNLSSRRGQVESQQERDEMRRITARVPLSEMFGYAMDLRQRTRGRGTLAMHFALYQPVDPPANRDDADDSLVRAPLDPTPTPRDRSAAVPEPLEDDLGDGFRR
jgi:translation elongation factor EF-G